MWQWQDSNLQQYHTFRMPPYLRIRTASPGAPGALPFRYTTIKFIVNISNNIGNPKYFTEKFETLPRFELGPLGLQPSAFAILTTESYKSRWPDSNRRALVPKTSEINHSSTPRGQAGLKLPTFKLFTVWYYSAYVVLDGIEPPTRGSSIHCSTY